jgi:hypothetical protein
MATACSSSTGPELTSGTASASALSTTLLAVSAVFDTATLAATSRAVACACSLPLTIKVVSAMP